MTSTLFSFMLFWAIWLLVPIFIDGSTAVAYLIGAWSEERAHRSKRRYTGLSYYPVVTVIIPIHNGAPFLKTCINSIKRQNYPPEKLEIFIIDNMSDDNGFAIFQDEQGKPWPGRLEWVSVPQKGKAYALNAGIHVSSGEYIANIDCDVMLHPDAIRNMIKAFVVEPDLAAATGSIEVLPITDTGADPVRHIIAECEFLEYYSGFRIGRQYQTRTNSLFTLAGAFSVFRRDILLQTFMYDKQTVSEDTRLTFELHKKFAKMKKACIGEAIAYVEPTRSLSALYAQRVRWQRGQLEVTALYPEFILTPLAFRGLASSKSLIVDHTLAFARVVWTFLLPMLYFVGYPLSMVISANIVMYCCYVMVEVAYISSSYIIANRGVRKRILRDWWGPIIMPVYRFILFWFRFGGFLSVLMEPAEWRVKDPYMQIKEGLADIKKKLSSLRGV